MKIRKTNYTLTWARRKLMEMIEELSKIKKPQVQGRLNLPQIDMNLAIIELQSAKRRIETYIVPHE